MTVVLLLTPLGCNNNRIGDSELTTLSPDYIKDIFGPRLAFEFLTKDSAFHHTLAIVSLTNDSIRFVLTIETPLNLFEYSGYAINDLNTQDNFDNFLTQGQNHFLSIKISKDRQEAEIIYFDDKRREVDRVTPDEIVDRYENTVKHQ